MLQARHPSRPATNCSSMTYSGTALAADPVHVERVSSAAQAVTLRRPYAEEAHTLDDPPADLHEHIAALSAHPDFHGYAPTGWSVKIVDLSKVIALQPMVFWDYARERTNLAQNGNMAELAKISIPIRSGPENIPVQFDQLRNTWMITSRNPNLKVVGNFSAPVMNGSQQFTGVGFMVTIMPSFIQVVRYRNRLVLRDGYHRSLGLLSRGIHRVPVLFKEFGNFDPMGIGPGMLPDAAYLGDRPPFLADYLDNTVSAEVNLPATQKMIVVQGIEMNPMG